MAQQWTGLVEPAWLAERLGRGDVVVVDCRFQLDDPSAGRRAYERDHIPGAVFFDLEQDLSGPPGAGSGRHPLPDLDQLAVKLGAAGIDQSTPVVCYDDQKGVMAGRMWWTLRFLGARQVGVLDGGYSAWRALGLPVTREVPARAPKVFVPEVQRHMLATMEDIRRMVQTGRGVLIDSRAPERYRGEQEPLDPLAGHIPGARNYPWAENVRPDGFYKDEATLRSRFAGLQGAEEVVVYCGSGVTACSNLLALERAGISGAKLYVGGWSEWCSCPENPISRGAEGER